jgi:transposase
MQKRKAATKQPFAPVATEGVNPALLVVGLDVGDRNTHYCMLDSDGTVTSEGSMLTKDTAIRAHFGGRARLRIALEAGSHSPWISRLLIELGHEVIVANARNLRMIAESDAKNDTADARMLARLARVGPDLLDPIEHRSKDVQCDLSVIRAREVAVATRTKMINAVRGLLKTAGHRIGYIDSSSFAGKALELCPPELTEAITPLLRLIKQLTAEIGHYDRLITKKAASKYPDSAAICSIPGVGPLTALTMILIMNNDPKKFEKSRDAGAYFGLRPKQRDSGQCKPQLGITKAGDHIFRRLATQSAQYILGPFGRDCALRRWGLSLANRGGKSAKKRAVIAVARKLVVLMHRLWRTQETFDVQRGLPPITAAA